MEIHPLIIMPAVTFLVTLAWAVSEAWSARRDLAKSKFGT